jgi:hypothetical protein
MEEVAVCGPYRSHTVPISGASKPETTTPSPRETEGSVRLNSLAAAPSPSRTLEE